MAKQENKNNSQEQTPVHPDPYKETVLVRYPKDGKVEVVSDMKMEQGKAHLVTTQPTLKNQPAFYQRKDSHFIANFMANFKAQAADPKDVPEFFIVPFRLVAQVAEKLFRLADNPKDVEGLKTSRQYRTSQAKLNKVRFDLPEMETALAEAKALGIDVDKMFQDPKDTTLQDLQLGKDSSNFFPLKLPYGQCSELEGNYAIRPVRDENDSVRFQYQAPLSRPEYESDERLRIELIKDEKEALYAGKTLNRLLMHNGEYCFAALNRRTNHMIYVPMKDVVVPDFIYNKRISKAQKEELSHGGRIMLEGCLYYNDDNIFKGEAQFSVREMNFIIEKPFYSKLYIPEHIRKQLTTEMFDTLMAGGEIDGRKLINKDGEPYTYNLRLDCETNSSEFIRYRSKDEQTFSQTKQQGQFSVPEQEEFPIPEPEPTLMEENMNQGMRQSARM